MYVSNPIDNVFHEVWQFIKLKIHKTDMNLRKNILDGKITYEFLIAIPILLSELGLSMYCWYMPH